jgi:hypothetical protein
VGYGLARHARRGLRRRPRGVRLVVPRRVQRRPRPRRETRRPRPARALPGVPRRSSRDVHVRGARPPLEPAGQRTDRPRRGPGRPRGRRLPPAPREPPDPPGVLEARRGVAPAVGAVRPRRALLPARGQRRVGRRRRPAGERDGRGGGRRPRLAPARRRGDRRRPRGGRDSHRGRRTVRGPAGRRRRGRTRRHRPRDARGDTLHLGVDRAAEGRPPRPRPVGGPLPGVLDVLRGPGRRRLLDARRLGVDRRARRPAVPGAALRATGRRLPDGGVRPRDGVLGPRGVRRDRRVPPADGHPDADGRRRARRALRPLVARGLFGGRTADRGHPRVGRRGAVGDGRQRTVRSDRGEPAGDQPSLVVRGAPGEHGQARPRARRGRPRPRDG